MKRNRMNCLALGVVVLAVCVLPIGAGAASKLVLVNSGKPVSCLVADPASTPMAQEMGKYVKKISGADVPIVEEGKEQGRTALYIGATKAAGEIVPELTDANVGVDGYIISPVSNGLAVVGRGEEGMWFGVYDLLYQIGCRRLGA